MDLLTKEDVDFAKSMAELKAKHKEDVPTEEDTNKLVEKLSRESYGGNVYE